MFLVLSLEVFAESVEYYGVFETFGEAEAWAENAGFKCVIKEVPLSPPPLEYKEVHYWRGWVDPATMELQARSISKRVLASDLRWGEELGHGYSTKSAEDAKETARQIYNEMIRNSYPERLQHLAEEQFIQPLTKPA